MTDIVTNQDVFDHLIQLNLPKTDCKETKIELIKEFYHENSNFKSAISES